jgi:hypothetical protein
VTRLDINPDRPERPDSGAAAGDWTSLKAWSQAIGLVGIPGTIAIFLVYVGATRVPDIERKLNEVIIKSDQIIHNQEDIKALQEILIRVTQRACSNAANDENARQRCFDR